MRVTKQLALAGVAFCALTLTACGGGLSVGGSAGAGGGGLASNGGGTSGGGGAGGAQTADNGTGGAGAGGTGASGSGAGGSGASGSGTGGVSTAGGADGQQASNLTGNGTVTVTAGGTTVSTPPLLTGPLAPVGTVVNTAGETLATAGNALLPTQVTSVLQGATSGLPLTANLANTSLGGAPTQPLGVSVLSNTAATGSFASANVLSAGQTASVSINPSGLTPALTGIVGNPTGALTGAVSPVINTATTAMAPVTSALAPVTAALPVTTTLGSATLTGGTAQQPIGVSVLAPTQATGTAATIGVLSGGNVATATLGNAGLGGATGAVTGAVTGTVGNVLDSASSLANANVLNQDLVTGPSPLLGASAASRQQRAGSVATVGVLSGGQPVTLGLGGRTLLGR